MALGDNFNAYTDGQPLSSESADWDVHVASGTGVMTLDMHDDHSDGTLVVDMSDEGDNYAIYQTQVGGNDHFAEFDCFADDFTENAGANQVGPIVRGSAASLGSGTFDGYMACLERENAGIGVGETHVRIYRIDDDVPTLLADSGDIAGQTYDGSESGTAATIRLDITGDALTASANGTDVVSTTDATYTTGQHVGVRQNRGHAAVDSQPFFDNFSGDTLGGGTPVAQATETDTSQPVTSAKAAQLGQPSETDTAQPVTTAKALTLAQTTETDTAQPITALKTHTVGQATETDQAQPVTSVGATPVGQTVETDTAQPITARKTITLGQPVETDAAQAVTLVVGTAVGQAVETDQAFAVTVLKTVTLGLAVEADTSLALVIADLSDPNPTKLSFREPAGITHRETFAITYQEPA